MARAGPGAANRLLLPGGRLPASATDIAEVSKHSNRLAWVLAYAGFLRVEKAMAGDPESEYEPASQSTNAKPSRELHVFPGMNLSPGGLSGGELAAKIISNKASLTNGALERIAVSALRMAAGIAAEVQLGSED